LLSLYSWRSKNPENNLWCLREALIVLVSKSKRRTLLHHMTHILNTALNPDDT